MVLIVPTVDAPLVLASSDDVYLAAGRLIGTTATVGSALRGEFSNHSVTIHGDVYAVYDAIWLGSAASLSNDVFIGPAGTLSSVASQGVAFWGSGFTVTNYGTITTQGGSGIGTFNSSTGVASAIRNFGDVIGRYGIQSTTDFDLRIENHGTISGRNGSIYSQSLVEQTTVFNRGLLSGNVDLGGGNDRLNNRGGEIIGDVFMGIGNDTLNNRDGEIDGSIDMGAGGDIFIAGRGEEVVIGGTERDALDLRAARVGVEFDMVDSEGNSVTTGDTYSGFEDVNGSYHGDTLRGDAGANLIQGRSGWDDLNGRGGADVLIGGWGRDTLTGGGGNDRFRYNSVEHGGDTITDFNATFDDIWIAVAGFGGGLVAGGTLAASQFRARTDNLAQDADDRFIFRTTDATLWFDANGSGGGGLSMVADLQAGAVVTASDIVLV